MSYPGLYDPVLFGTMHNDELRSSIRDAKEGAASPNRVVRRNAESLYEALTDELLTRATARPKKGAR